MKPLHGGASEMTFDMVAELTRRNKRELVATWRPGTEDREIDLVTHAVVVRDQKNVAIVFAAPVGAHGARRAAYAAAALFRADEVFVIGETIHRKKLITPEEAENIKPGEMFDAWEAGRREGLEECLTMQRFNRQGFVEGRTYPFSRVGATVTWREPTIIQGAKASDLGAIADYVREGFAAGDEVWAEIGPLAGLAADMLDLPEDERQMHIDRACAQQASEMDGGTAVVLEPYAMFIAGKEVGK